MKNIRSEIAENFELVLKDAWNMTQESCQSTCSWCYRSVQIILNIIRICNIYQILFYNASIIFIIFDILFPFVFSWSESFHKNIINNINYFTNILVSYYININNTKYIMNMLFKKDKNLMMIMKNILTTLHFVHSDHSLTTHSPTHGVLQIRCSAGFGILLQYESCNEVMPDKSSFSTQLFWLAKKKKKKKED